MAKRTDRISPEKEQKRAVRSPHELTRQTQDDTIERRNRAVSSGRPSAGAERSAAVKRDPKDIAWEEGIVRTAGGVDKVMLALVILLVALGSVMVFSASYPYALSKYGDSMYFIKQQLKFVLLGSVAMTVLIFVPYQFFRKFAPAIYGFSLVLLVLVLIIGQSEGVAKRWIYIPGVGLSFQPSEVMKLALVLALAWYLERFRDQVVARGRGHGKEMIVCGVIGPALIIGLACGLVLLEKHLSGTMILAGIGVSVLIAGGAHFLYMALILGGGGLGAGTLFLFANPYAMERLQQFLNNGGSDVVTDDRWQTVHGLWAISSGGFLGLGLGQSRLKYMWVSQAHNDFIFTIWCEEMGFVGAVFLIVLFALFVWRGYVIAMRAPDTFSSLTVFGITTKVAIQVILNIAVVTDIIPNTGISLPFFSYGGSSLMMLLVEMGIVLAISRHSYQKR